MIGDTVCLIVYFLLTGMKWLFDIGRVGTVCFDGTWCLSVCDGCFSFSGRMRVFEKDGAGVRGVSPVEGRERGSGGFEEVIVKDGVLLCLGDI